MNIQTRLQKKTQKESYLNKHPDTSSHTLTYKKKVKQQKATVNKTLNLTKSTKYTTEKLNIKPTEMVFQEESDKSFDSMESKNISKEIEDIKDFYDVELLIFKKNALQKIVTNLKEELETIKIENAMLKAEKLLKVSKQTQTSQTDDHATLESYTKTLINEDMSCIFSNKQICSPLKTLNRYQTLSNFPSETKT